MASAAASTHTTSAFVHPNALIVLVLFIALTFDLYLAYSIGVVRLECV